MKRRAPAITAGLLGLGVAYLAYSHEQQSAERARKEAEAEKQKSYAKAAAESEPPAEKTSPEALLAEPAPVPVDGAGKFHLMPDGTPVPGLPTSAPERVKLGVVIFRYKGAQGASDSDRSREAALALAKEATELAKNDFAAAIKKGDRGSSDNIGWIPQRILERAVEYQVFSLETGAISAEPIDTPRGFWVAKRIR